MRRAIALRYGDTDEAPVVVSSGEGDLANRIERAALDYAVPVVRDVPLADALRDLAVGDAIPEALYEAVAAILRELADASGVSVR
jgi:flagellar biosynthesis protein